MFVVGYMLILSHMPSDLNLLFMVFMAKQLSCVREYIWQLLISPALTGHIFWHLLGP